METLKQITRAAPPRTVLVAATAALVAVSGAAAYGISLHQRLRLTDRALITTSDTASDSFRNSATIRGLVNPRGHTAWQDSRSTTLLVPPGAKVPTEQALLSGFVRGFFGGRVFLPERLGLQLLRRRFVVFDGLAPSTAPQHVNRVSDLPVSLPPLHSVFWGAFQVTDLHVGEEGTGSSIDFVYGSSRGGFAGCHRFTVRKERRDDDDDDDDGEGEGDRVFVSMECITCNPNVDKPIGSKFVARLHGLYALMLFRDAVGEVHNLLGW